MHCPQARCKRRPGSALAGVILAITTAGGIALASTPGTAAAAATRHPATSRPAMPRAATPRPGAPGSPPGASPAAAQVQGGPELGRGGVIVNYPSPRFARLPDPQADAFVIADADTGQVLAAKNPHAWYGPASTLKILTAISLIPVLNPNATTTASKDAVSQEPDDVGLAQGHQYRIADLFRGLLLISGNDAAVSLAEATGSYAQGIALMNAEAHRLQAYDTVAKTPNGLDAPGQHVSAYDQALIARQALRNQAFMAYDTTRSAWFGITVHHWVQLINQDTLLDSYQGFLGGKTGWTTPAKATYTGMARRNGHTVIVTLLHAVPLTWRTTAPALLDWGFAADGKVQPVGQLVNPVPPPAPAPKPAAGHHAVKVAPADAAHGTDVVPVIAALVAIGALAVLGFILVAARRAAMRR
jgi:serine-type D-Ala-D-Ala carboxypeptidase (penicillin-binding protein 5/6)